MVVAREKLINSGKPGVYHCVSRVVRRAYLLGEDPFSGKNYDHRKDWVRNRLIHLAGCFALEVPGYAVMINHTHTLVRTCPGVAAKWSDSEVADRWLSVYPKQIKRYARSKETMEAAIEKIVSEPEIVEELRRRLSSISWFMACLNEYLARKANKEDGCTGRFWAGRFKSTVLLDDSAVLAGLTYVDLNPVRAGVAETPEESGFTSAQDRIVARQARKKLSKLKEKRKQKARKKKQDTAKQVELVEDVKRALQRDSWLSSFGKVVEGERKSFLNMELDEYLELLDWTGRQVKEGKRGKIPPHLADILERLEIETDRWVDTVLHFGSLFFRVAGKVQSILRATQRSGQKWLRGKPNAKEAFG